MNFGRSDLGTRNTGPPPSHHVQSYRPSSIETAGPTPQSHLCSLPQSCLFYSEFRPRRIKFAMADFIDPRMSSIKPRVRYNTIGGINGPLVILDNVSLMF